MSADILNNTGEFPFEIETPVENVPQQPMNKKVIRWNFVFQYGYVLTNIISSFILLPLYLTHIPSAVLGLWLASGSILTWMTLTDPGVGDVLQQKIAELRGKGMLGEVGTTIGSGFIAAAGFFLLSIAAGTLFFDFLGYLIDKDISRYPDLRGALMISILATALSLFSFSMSGINQGLHNSANVAISSLLSNVLFLIVNLLLLLMGWGVLSIALANLVRALFINVYNIVAMRKVLRFSNLRITYQLDHFKKFMRIFSVTSAARIVGGLSGSIDLMILARFVPPEMVTVFEMNKRPVKMTQSLIGRHSVALMPSVSHAKGQNNYTGITNLIDGQFRLYSYAAIFISLLFWLTYQGLIAVWVGKTQYAGDTVLYLMIAGFAFGLIGYFMANMGYALGDIRRNSLANIVRGLINIVLLFTFAGKYGIIGILTITLFSALIDFFYFSFRLHQMGYLRIQEIKSTLARWLVIIPCGGLSGWVCRWFVENLTPVEHDISRIVLTGFFFTVCFMAIVILTDNECRIKILKTKNLFFLSPAIKKA